MQRRKFIRNTSIFITGTPFLSTLPISHQAENVAIIRRLAPILRKFIAKVFNEGVEKYAVDKLVTWLEEKLDNEKSGKEEMKIFEESTEINLNFYGDVNVLSIIDSHHQKISSTFPFIRKSSTHFERISKSSFVPIIQHSQYLTYFHFPELAALNKLSIELCKKYKRLIQSSKTLQELILPNQNGQIKRATSFPNRQVHTCIYRTMNGIVFIKYKIDSNLNVCGEVFFKPNAKNHRINDIKEPFEF